MTKPKPCPFCGSKNVEVIYPNEAADALAVVCRFCYSSGPAVFIDRCCLDYPLKKGETIDEATEREAIRRWNLAKR